MSGTIVDAYGERKAAEVMEDTWGHLAPKKGKTYDGYIIFVYSPYRDIILLDSSFEGLSDSPWLFNAMMKFVEDNVPEKGLYKWTGKFIVNDDDTYAFKGKKQILTFEEILKGDWK